MKRKPKNADLSAARENLKREVLPPEYAEPRIKPVTIDWNLGGITTVFSGTVPLLKLNMPQIERKSRKYYRIIRELLVLLNNIAYVASDAVRIADVEIGTKEQLDVRRPEAIAGRVKQAALKREAWDSTLRLLQREADDLREKDPTMPVAEIRAKLRKIPGVTGRMVRAVKITRPRKNLPRPNESR